MTGASRLLSVRLQGFKSFAERTHLAFGPGISAVVGPNGSGKSNLADALRWALGEQGRALRSRKAEDVIWAGSERRPALGMADVQLVIDNADGLLPVEYGVVELGRRLYRSGENDYLLNRQRVRLRDLVDLLDGAHLADNAFLFIGQGMVDQALALRPEERRPLFEEVAGVRRHERRRRRAEEQLAESEANLARVDDILGELRPQARRLAAQAEQQTSRRSAGDELAVAILAAAHARWHAAALRIDAAGAEERDARALLQAAMRELGEHETTLTALTVGLRERSLLEGERRTGLEVAQARLTDVRLRAGRTASDLAGVIRDRNRIAGERPELESAIARAAGVAGRLPHVREPGLETELAEAERALADAGAEGSDPDGDEAGAIRRLESAHRAEVETARRRLSEAERTLATEAPRARAAAVARDAAVAARDAAEGEATTRQAAIEPARRERAAAESALASSEAAASSLAAQAAAATARAAALQARLDAAERLAAEEARDGFAIAATQRGGRRLGDEVVIEPDLRAAARAALAGLDRAFVLRREVVTELGAERGMAVVAESQPGGDRSVIDDAFAAVVRTRGGGLLSEAIRRDERGIGGRLLARAVWLPDLAGCLDLQGDLPAGWIAVPRDGSAVVGELVVRLGPASDRVDARAEADVLRAEGVEAEAGAASATTAADQARGEVVARRDALEAARSIEAASIAALRATDERSRAAGAAADGATREAAWLTAQADRVRGDVDRLRTTLETPAVTPSARAAAGAEAPHVEPTSTREIAWKARTAALRARRDRLATLVADAELRARQHDTERASAETALSLGRGRLATLDGLALDTVEREAILLETCLASDDVEGHRIECRQSGPAKLEGRLGTGPIAVGSLALALGLSDEAGQSVPALAQRDTASLPAGRARRLRERGRARGLRGVGRGRGGDAKSLDLGAEAIDLGRQPGRVASGTIGRRDRGPFALLRSSLRRDRVGLRHAREPEGIPANVDLVGGIGRRRTCRVGRSVGGRQLSSEGRDRCSRVGLASRATEADDDVRHERSAV